MTVLYTAVGEPRHVSAAMPWAGIAGSSARVLTALRFLGTSLSEA